MNAPERKERLQAETQPGRGFRHLVADHNLVLVRYQENALRELYLTHPVGDHRYRVGLEVHDILMSSRFIDVPVAVDAEIERLAVYLKALILAKLEYPLNESSVTGALKKFDHIYVSVVPDKGMYLAQQNGYPAMDYRQLFEKVKSGMDWAQFVDISDLLTGSDYYRTDTHWRQERLPGVARRLCTAMGADFFDEAFLTEETVTRPFYGVYYGQAALPMEPETIRYLTNDEIEACTVYNYENGKTTSVYDMEKLESRDLYDIYLSGAAALLRITNPNGDANRELVVFRDSFGSSLIPLLLKDYGTVTVVDTRYIAADLLGQFLQFDNQDVLFLYSTLILNSSNVLK